jgi:hypothetical protein
LKGRKAEIERVRIPLLSFADSYFEEPTWELIFFNGCKSVLYYSGRKEEREGGEVG